MPGIVEFPQVVQDAMAQYGDIFANECQRRHFAEYLTGLMVAERKTVLGINSEFAQTTDQSCLNRFLTDAQWDPAALNHRRLEELQKDPSTRYSDQGVIAIDNTLIDRDGLLIPDAGWFWDHAEERNKIAQDYLFANYVCTSGKHYPLEFRLFRKQEVCEALKEPFRNHTVLCCELIDWVCERQIPGDFTMDSYFTCPRSSITSTASRIAWDGLGVMSATSRATASWSGRDGSSRPTIWRPRSRHVTARRCGSATNGSGTSR